MAESLRRLSVTPRLQRILAALGIQPGEGTATGLLFAQSFLLGIAIFLLYTVSNSLFLSQFEAQAMAYVYMVSAALLILIGIFFSRLEQALSFPLLLLGTMGGLLLVTLALGLGLQWGSPSWFAFLLMIGYRLFWTLSNLVIWALAGRLFDVRQSKRLFPLIVVATVLAIIVGGLSNDALLAAFGIVNLVWVAWFALLAATLVMAVPLHIYRRRLASGDAPRPESGLTAWRQMLATYRSRYIYWILAFAVISTLANYTLEFIFLHEANSRFQGAEAYAGFFGTYMSLATFVLLVVSVLGSTILNRLGVRFGLLVNPAAVTVLALLAGLGLLLLGNGGFLFWLIVLTKLSDDVLVISMNNTAQRILFQPLPAGQRTNIQAAIESVVTPFAMGLAGLLLVIIQIAGTVTTGQTLFWLIAMGVAWLFIGARTHRHYRRALQNALYRRRLDNTPVEIPIREQEPVLLEGLQSPESPVVLYSLQLLDQSSSDCLNAALPPLLHHPTPEVRLEAVRRLAQVGSTDASFPALLRRRLADEEDGEVRGAVLQSLIALGDRETLDDAAAYLTHEDPVLQTAALIGLLRSGSIQNILTAGPHLLALTRSPAAADRARAAFVIGQVGDSRFYQPLQTLLQDSDVGVRTAALDAGGRVGNPVLWPPIAQGLTDTATRKQALRALVRGGEAALRAMAERYSQPDTPAAVRGAVARATGQIGGDRAQDLLWTWIDDGDRHVQAEIWRGLRYSGFRSSDSQQTDIVAHMDQELDRARWFLGARLAVLDGGGRPILADALLLELTLSRGILFDLLSLLGHADLISRVRRVLDHAAGRSGREGSGVQEQRAYAQEILEELASLAQSAALVPLLSQDLASLSPSDLAAGQMPPDHSDAEWLSLLRRADESQITPWTRVCARYVADTEARPTGQDPEWGHRPNEDSQKWSDTAMLTAVETVLHLKRAEIFGQIPNNVLATVAAIVEPVEYLPDAVVFHQGEPGDAMFLVVSGQIRISDNGFELARLGPGTVFGELALLDDEPRSASATALEETLLLRLPQDAFYELLDDYPEIARGVLSVITRQLRARSRELTRLRGETHSTPPGGMH